MPVNGYCRGEDNFIVVQFRFGRKHIAGTTEAAEIGPSGIQEPGRNDGLHLYAGAIPMRWLPEDVGNYHGLTIESHIFASLRRRSMLTAECVHAKVCQGVSCFAGSLA